MTHPLPLVDLVAISGRVTVLIIAALAGVLCIYLGWRLYRDSLLTKTTGEARFSGMRLRLVAAGPGVFFAAFGMWLLVQLVNRPFESQASEGPQEATQAMANDDAATWKMVDVAEREAQATTPPCKCLVRYKLTRLYDGEAPPTPAEIASSLDIANRVLAQAAIDGRLGREEASRAGSDLDYLRANLESQP